MTNEIEKVSEELQKIPEISDELLNGSKKILEKICQLVEKIKDDIDSDNKGRRGAAIVVIHIIMKAVTKGLN